MRWTHTDLDGVKHELGDGLPEPVAPTDPAAEIAALKAELEKLRAGTVTVAQRAGMTKLEAEALVKVATVTKP